MIIDCHGHYTTAPRELEAYRQRQISALKDPSRFSFEPPKITDDQIRESLENAQLKFQRERGTDLTIFSPRAMGMGHHIGNATTSLQWSRVCNDLICRVCSLYPENFAGVRQLHRRIRALRGRARFRWLQPESGSFGRALERPAPDGPLLVPALRKDGRA